MIAQGFHLLLLIKSIQKPFPFFTSQLCNNHFRREKGKSKITPLDHLNTTYVSRSKTGNHKKTSYVRKKGLRKKIRSTNTFTSAPQLWCIMYGTYVHIKAVTYITFPNKQDFLPKLIRQKYKRKCQTHTRRYSCCMPL